MKPALLAFSFCLSAALHAAAPVGAPATPPAKAAAPAKAESAEFAALRAKAERGNSIAQYNLGLAYVQGRQVAADPVTAFIWLTLAAEGGSTGKALETVLNQMTPAQLEDGRRRLAALRLSNPFLRPATPVASAKSTGPAAAPAAAAAAAATAAAPAARPASSDEAKHLYDQLNVAGQEKRELTTEVAALQAQLKEAQAALAVQAAELAAARQEAAALKARLAPLENAPGTRVSTDAAAPSEPSPARPDPDATTSSRVHTIALGETLAAISRLYYGTADRWQDIFAANRDAFGEKRSMIAGRTLRIP